MPKPQPRKDLQDSHVASHLTVAQRIQQLRKEPRIWHEFCCTADFIAARDGELDLPGTGCGGDDGPRLLSGLQEAVVNDVLFAGRLVRLIDRAFKLKKAGVSFDPASLAARMPGGPLKEDG